MYLYTAHITYKKKHKGIPVFSHTTKGKQKLLSCRKQGFDVKWTHRGIAMFGVIIQRTLSVKNVSTVRCTVIPLKRWSIKKFLKLYPIGNHVMFI